MARIVTLADIGAVPEPGLYRTQGFLSLDPETSLGADPRCAMPDLDDNQGCEDDGSMPVFAREHGLIETIEIA